MRNVLILAIAQFFGSCGQVVTVLLAGIIGGALAPDPRLATVPLTIATFGIAAATLPAGWLMQRFGRRRVFIAGAIWPACGALLAIAALELGSFWLYSLACAVMGSQLAIIVQYRFAAAESVAPHQVARAVSWIMLGTVVAGVISPWLVTSLRNTVGVEFVGSYLALTVAYLLGAVTLRAYQEPPSAPNPGQEAARPLREIARQPEFRVAVGAAAAAYGVMSLIMTATPVSMHAIDHYSVEETMLVLQSHTLGMYLPSLISGLLVGWLGIRLLMFTGLVAEAACIGFATAGHDLHHYWLGLVALGIGWNFLFVAATTLLTRTYRASERYRVQSFNDFVMFGIMGSVSMLAGVLVNTVGWQQLNQLALLPLIPLLIAVLRLRHQPT